MKHSFVPVFHRTDWMDHIESVASCMKPDNISRFIDWFHENNSGIDKIGDHGIENNFLHSSGDVWVSKTAKIGPGVVVEGPVLIDQGAIIGPNSYLRGPVFIGQACEVGFSVEIKQSIILSNVILRHFVYVGNSIIGNHCNLGANFITAVSRLDNEVISIRHLDKEYPIGRKAGCVMGDRTISGVGVTTMPGRIVPPDSVLMPGEIYYG